MTVKCLEAWEKELVALRFLGGQPLTDLSYEFKVSRRTIIRVLEEQNIDPGVKTRAKPQPVDLGEIEHPISEEGPTGELAKPAPAPIPTKTPWYRRFKEWLFGTPEQQDQLNELRQQPQ